MATDHRGAVDARSRIVLRAGAVRDLLFAALLLLGSWDGLYDAIELPQAKPALLVQLGGIALLGFAYLLWVAPESRALARRISEVGVFGNAAGAILIGAWLLFRDAELDLGIEQAGVVVLIVLMAILLVSAALDARVARDNAPESPTPGPGV